MSIKRLVLKLIVMCVFFGGCSIFSKFMISDFVFALHPHKRGLNIRLGQSSINSSIFSKLNDYKNGGRYDDKIDTNRYSDSLKDSLEIEEFREFKKFQKAKEELKYSLNNSNKFLFNELKETQKAVDVAELKEFQEFKKFQEIQKAAAMGEVQNKKSEGKFRDGLKKVLLNGEKEFKKSSDYEKLKKAKLKIKDSSVNFLTTANKDFGEGSGFNFFEFSSSKINCNYEVFKLACLFNGWLKYLFFELIGLSEGTYLKRSGYENEEILSHIGKSLVSVLCYIRQIFNLLEIDKCILDNVSKVSCFDFKKVVEKMFDGFDVKLSLKYCCPVLHVDSNELLLSDLFNNLAYRNKAFEKHLKEFYDILSELKSYCSCFDIDFS